MRTDRRHRRNYNELGHAHELTFCCFGRYPFLRSERTCEWFAEAVKKARSDHQFEVWAYVIMPEHVHLMIHPLNPDYDIAAIRQAIKEPVGRVAMRWLEAHAPDWLPRLTVNSTSRSRRHFWLPGGGYDRNVIELKTLITMIEYIHLNPVRRGLAERAAEWKWSSARWFVDMAPSPIPVDPIPPEWPNLE